MSGSWKTKGFAMFRQGTFGNGGQNIYVSKRGVLQRIYQYDLNHNGYFDLFFANCQNHHEATPAYIYRNIFENAQCDKLPAQGAISAVVKNFSNGEYCDIVIANNYDAAAPFASSDIYFGGASNYGENRHIRLPAPWANSVTAGKFSGESFSLAYSLDVYKKIRIFQFSNGTFEWNRFIDLELQNGQLSAGDLDGDGYEELIVRPAKSNDIYIYWGSANGLNKDNYTKLEQLDKSEDFQVRANQAKRSELEQELVTPILAPVLEINGTKYLVRISDTRVIFYSFNKNREYVQAFSLYAPKAHSVCAGNLRNNGLQDIAIATQHSVDNQQYSYLYLNENNSFSEENRIAIPTLQASDIVIDKFDNSNFGAVAISQNHTELSYSRDIIVYHGNSNGIDRTPILLPCEDTQRIFAVPRPDGVCELLAINHFSRSAVGMSEGYLYYGSKDGYSAENREELPCWCAVDSIYADFDDDGWAELLVCNNSENAMHRDPGSHIHHFSEKGFVKEKSYCVPTEIGWAGFTADLRSSGYLDIVLVYNQYKDIIIFHGSEDKYSKKNSTIITLEENGVHYGSPRWIGGFDLNKNGYLDLVIPIINNDRTLILWGGPDGYSMKNKSELSILRGACAHAADLNNNGYLDLIIGTHVEIPKEGKLTECMPHNSFIHIYWNDGNGLRENNKTTLRCNAADSLAIADFRNSGYLDIFAGSYHTGKERDSHSIFYWNDKGNFSEKNSQFIYTHSASGCVAADFNEDGYIDLAIANHKVKGDHQGFSSVWWNSAKGFSKRRRTNLPTSGPHGMTAIAPGNIMDRSNAEYYTSKIENIADFSKIIYAEIVGEIPAKCQVKIRFRASAEKSELEKQLWSDFYEVNTELDITLLESNFAQYQLALIATNCLRTPRITEVNITLIP